MNSHNTGSVDKNAQRLSIFLKGSSRILEFSSITLLGTGIGSTLCDFFIERLGQERFDAWSERLAALPPSGPEKAQKVTALLADLTDGPPTRNLIYAWYTGTWTAIPGVLNDTTQVISSRAYQEALVWPLIGAHPGGAKQQGWDSWSRPPSTSPLR
ncbi:hypothetical protein PQR72_42355 [Paraburkholderia madseniana]|jgi:hypothetical protein|uniref:hypothetical protein n=1 Tax=Paraburkholderia madseniana TaxID=2599607 RepID=UPI0015C55D34|nr:hypothetical protein [Paraburkholderia madseniana]NPT70723.1 hypothetical protein [Paraburkholderia madseniana]